MQALIYHIPKELSKDILVDYFSSLDDWKMIYHLKVDGRAIYSGDDISNNKGEITMNQVQQYINSF